MGVSQGAICTIGVWRSAVVNPYILEASPTNLPFELSNYWNDCTLRNLRLTNSTLKVLCLAFWSYVAARTFSQWRYVMRSESPALKSDKLCKQIPMMYVNTDEGTVDGQLFMNIIFQLLEVINAIYWHYLFIFKKCQMSESVFKRTLKSPRLPAWNKRQFYVLELESVWYPLK